MARTILNLSRAMARPILNLSSLVGNIQAGQINVKNKTFWRKE
jgi:hypothetical protein